MDYLNLTVISKDISGTLDNAKLMANSTTDESVILNKNSDWTFTSNFEGVVLNRLNILLMMYHH